MHRAKFSQGARAPGSPGDGQTSCKVGWPLVSDVAAVTLPRRETVEISWVSQTGKPISAVSGPKFAILWGHVEEVLMLNKFFALSICALVAKIQPDKVV